MLISFSMQAQPVKKYGQLKVVSTQLVDQKGIPVVLRGMSFGWHNWWPQFYNAGAVKWLYEDWNCSISKILQVQYKK
jgi:endoglucanase